MIYHYFLFHTINIDSVMCNPVDYYRDYVIRLRLRVVIVIVIAKKKRKSNCTRNRNRQKIKKMYLVIVFNYNSITFLLNLVTKYY